MFCPSHRIHPSPGQHDWICGVQLSESRELENVNAPENATILHACCFVPPTECIPRLVSVIEHPESKQPENINATENAISAVVKICKYNGSKVNVDDIIPRLMHWLPVTEDVDEAVHIYNYICDLLEA